MGMRRCGSSLVVGALIVATLCVAIQAQDVIVVANEDVSISEVTDTELRDSSPGREPDFMMARAPCQHC